MLMRARSRYKTESPAVIADVLSPNHTARASEQHPIGVRLTEVVGASVAGASAVLDIDDAVSVMRQAARGDDRVSIGTLSSMANGFLCDLITTSRLRRRRADRCYGRGLSRAGLLCPKGRLDVVVVLRFPVVPQWTWNNSGRSASL
jgi:hypothetical protein